MIGYVYELPIAFPFGADFFNELLPRAPAAAKIVVFLFSSMQLLLLDFFGKRGNHCHEL